MTHLDYEETPKKRFPWGWVIGGIVLLLFGACSFALVGTFKNIGDVKPMNDAFIAEILASELPRVREGYYSETSNVTDDLLAPMNLMITTLGAPEEIGETSCSANSYAGTEKPSGQFVTCSGPVTYATTPATLKTIWRKENEGWKLLEFAFKVTDLEAYGQLVAERERPKADAPE